MGEIDEICIDESEGDRGRVIIKEMRDHVESRDESFE